MKQGIMLSFLLLATAVYAEDMWSHFTADDFARRREQLMEKIPDGVVILVGAEIPAAARKFRQDNTFYYFSGVEVPDALIMIDGRRKRSLLFVPDETSKDIKEEARIAVGKEAAGEYKFDSVLSRSKFTETIGYTVLFSNPVVYLYMWPQETAMTSPDGALKRHAKRLNDPWDSRMPREIDFVNLFKERFPTVKVEDISEVIHDMRWIKDEKEIAVLRECGKIGAEGFNEAMKITRPGIYEYQVAAACDFIYQYRGQQNPAFFPIAASGERGLSWHYNANNHKLESGDVILLDYAPDYHYYVTDITRTWPVNGKFSKMQLKFYKCLVEAHKSIIAAMKPGITYADMQEIGKGVYEKHGLGKYWFGYVGHLVGMAVHDVGPRHKPLEAGVVFNVEPIVEDKDKKIHFRLEDTVVITETGAEVLTSGTPIEIEAIYALIKSIGLLE